MLAKPPALSYLLPMIAAPYPSNQEEPNREDEGYEKSQPHLANGAGPIRREDATPTVR